MIDDAIRFDAKTGMETGGRKAPQLTSLHHLIPLHLTSPHFRTKYCMPKECSKVSLTVPSVLLQTPFETYDRKSSSRASSSLSTMEKDAILAAFGRKYDHVRGLFDDNKLDDGINEAQDLLDDGDLPRYLRIKTLIVLAAAASNWHDTEACRTEAETLWSLARRYHPEGYDATADEALAELRVLLERVKEAQIER